MSDSRVSSNKKITYILLAILWIQIIFIVWINLFKCHDFVEHDASMLYSHTIHMWEQEKLVIPNYQEETFFHLDTSCILALPLYGLTHDIFLAYGISNIIFLLLTLLIMNDLLKRLHVKDMYRYAGLLLYIIPYRLGLAQYLNMLFFECSFYNVCILVTVLAIDLFLYKKPETNDRKESLRYLAMLVIYALFTVLTAFSRGTYTLLVALLPAILCYALDVILSPEGLRHIERSKVVVIFVTFAAYAAGMGYARMKGFVPNKTGYKLVYVRDLVDNFIGVIWGHFCIFIGLTNPDVFTKEGIFQLILTAYAILIIIMIVFNLKHAFKDEEYSSALRYLTIIYLWNCAILGLTESHDSTWGFPERYLLPGFVPLLLSAPIMLTYMEKIKRDLLRQCTFLVVSVLTCLTLGVCNLNAMEKIWQTNVDLQGVREVLSYARANGIDTVFFVNDFNAALISRSLDPGLHVAPVDKLDDGSIIINTREDYASAHDRGSYSDDNLLAMTWYEQPENVFSDYQISSYQYVGDVKDYHLYRAGSNKFDDMSGFPIDDHHIYKTTDFCYSPGYQATGNIDLYGYLEATGVGDYVLTSPFLDAPYAACNVSLTYEMGHKTADGETEASAGNERAVGKLMLLDQDGNEIKSADIVSGSESVSVTADPSQPCFVAVWLDKGEKVTLCRLDFEMML
ncbi:MAG: hypothetical protein K6G27_14240 [Lachnospiraceae bacterium]|nr:hypothetical protein [Lachnospiraceae bacterium]